MLELSQEQKEALWLAEFAKLFIIKTGTTFDDAADEAKTCMEMMQYQIDGDRNSPAKSVEYYIDYVCRTTDIRIANDISIELTKYSHELQHEQH